MFVFKNIEPGQSTTKGFILTVLGNVGFVDILNPIVGQSKVERRILKSLGDFNKVEFKLEVEENASEFDLGQVLIGKLHLMDAN